MGRLYVFRPDLDSSPDGSCQWVESGCRGKTPGGARSYLRRNHAKCGLVKIRPGAWCETASEELFLLLFSETDPNEESSTRG